MNGFSHSLQVAEPDPLNYVFYFVSKPTFQPDIWQLFIPLLAEAVSRPTDQHPTVRVWKDTELIWVINRLAKEHQAELKTTFPPGGAVLDKLKKMKWLRQLPLAENVTGRAFYLMDMEAQKGAVADALELLQAALPEGVISYFSALGFHELTTQTPAFAHIGRLAKGHPPDVEPARASEQGGQIVLGTMLFEYDGTPCYETKRYRGLCPGVQTRVIGPRTYLHITTLEQTLLDTLLHPLRCGGEAVVFESWGHAGRKVDFDRMAGHLQAIGRKSLLRRVGAILEMNGVAASQNSTLEKLLRTAKTSAGRPEDILPLLPGLDYPQINRPWGVALP